MDNIWTMRDGTKIHISDMTNEHLINTINMLNRKYKATCDLYRELTNSEKILSINVYFTQYDNLVVEAKKRRLRMPATYSAMETVWNTPGHSLNFTQENGGVHGF